MAEKYLSLNQQDTKFHEVNALMFCKSYSKISNSRKIRNMKRILTNSITFVIFLSLLLSVPAIKAQSDTTWTKEKAASWFNQADWLKGLKLHPHQSTDKLEFAKQYQANKASWDIAFAFLRDNNLDSLKTGHYVIDGDKVFADITDNPSSTLKDAKWHSHRQYCDIMYVIKGKETTGIASIAGAPVIIPFKDKDDSQFYNQEMKGSYYLSNTDTFLILFPSDVHRPFIKVEGNDKVKRIRMKIVSR